MASKKKDDDLFLLACHGAAGTVTGSKHLVTAAGSRILLDAGLFQGLKELRLRNWDSPRFNPREVDHVVLSHTHIDHVGYLPRLVREGLDAPVHCTPAAHDLAKLMLLDSAHIQEEDARRAKRKGYSKHEDPKPLYTTQDAWDALNLRQTEHYGEWFDLHPQGKIRGRYHGAGHLLGSAFIELAVEDGDREVRIVYSGDIGRFDAPLHPDPGPLPACDVLIMESTYGDRLHTDESVVDQLQEPLKRTLGNRGTVLIPAFAVGRAQIVILVLRRLMREGAIPEVPIHLDSPMSIHATEIYSRFLDERNVDVDVFEDGRRRLFPDHVNFHETVSDSKRLNTLGGPRIIVSASGMLSGGRVIHHLKRLAADPRNLVVLSGYQAKGTRGRALLEGARELKAYGSRFPVRCEVTQVHGFSGHADQEELLRWVESAPEKPSAIFLVHGEPEASEALKERLAERIGVEAILPEPDLSYDLRDLLGERKALAAKRARDEERKARRPQPPSPPAKRHRALPQTQRIAPDEGADERIERILESPSYQRVDQDASFLQRDELRAARLQLEYMKPHLLLSERGVVATIVAFGGTRVIEGEDARKRLEKAEKALAEAGGKDPELEYEVRRAERVVAKARYYGEARKLGRIVGEAGGGPTDPRLLVVTGGGPGIMEAANRGAFDVGAESLGFNITLPHEQFPNAYITPELCFQFRYFALRKMHFVMRAKALVAFPGGYGTLDELFETLCLIQTRKIEPLPVVLVGEEFWRGVFDAEHLALEGVIDPEDVELFWFAETAEEVWEGIQAWYERRGESLFEICDRAAEEERGDG